MLTDQQFQTVATAAIDQLDAMCREREDHRVNMIGFVAHRLGLRSYDFEALIAFADVMRHYEAGCPSCRAGEDHREG